MVLITLCTKLNEKRAFDELIVTSETHINFPQDYVELKFRQWRELLSK